MLFTPEELRDESRSLSEMAIEALARGHVDRVRFLLGRMSVGHFELYVGYVSWIAQMAGKILRDFGEPFFESASFRIARFLMAPYIKEIREGKEKQVFSELISLWCHQMGRIDPLGETSNEVAFSLAPCGSGGRLLLEGWYEVSPDLYPRLKDGKPIFCRICDHLQQAVNEAVEKACWNIEPNASREGFCRASFLKHGTGGGHLFKPEELYQVTTPRCQQALQSLDRGHTDIQGLLEEQHTEWRPLHDFLCLWVTCLFSLVYKEKGTDYLSELVWETYARMFDSGYLVYSMQDDMSLFRNLVRNWHYHQATFSVTEDEDRFAFLLDPCGSGGRLYRGEMGKEGAFQYGSEFLCEIGEASDLTFQRAPFPIYCIHCAATNRDQLTGKPWAFLVDGNAQCDPSTPCLQYLYKKNAPRIASPALLAQVGLSDVKPLKKEYIL